MSVTLLLATALGAIGICILTRDLFNRELPANIPPLVRNNYPLIGAWRFWTHRWNFFQDAARHSPTGNFSFHAGNHLIVGLTGEQGRRVFYETRELSLAEGYAPLFGQAAEMKMEGGYKSTVERISRYLTYFLRTEMLRVKFPTLVDVVRSTMKTIKEDPRDLTDPFESVYGLVFRLLIRMMGANELLGDPEFADSILRFYGMLDESAGAAVVIFSNTPTLPWLKRAYAGARLYMLVNKVVKRRRRSVRREDGLQYLLDQGESSFAIVEFILGTLFAGLINSGINAAAMLSHLACAPEWAWEVREEARHVVNKYAKGGTRPMSEKLKDVPFEAFDSDFPVTYMCFRETIRLHGHMVQFRRNVGNYAIPLGASEVIPSGAFAAYHTGDVHMNPQVYPNPELWDPARHSPDKVQDKSTPQPFVGWGQGRHPCMGIRFAKLEQNIITAYVVANFDFHLEDEHGTTVVNPPELDRNQHGPEKPRVPHVIKVTPRDWCV